MTLNCAHCGKEITTGRMLKRRFCTQECNIRWHSKHQTNKIREAARAHDWSIILTPVQKVEREKFIKSAGLQRIIKTGSSRNA